jgi:hypothetical protein
MLVSQNFVVEEAAPAKIERRVLPRCEADMSADVICEIDEQIELGFPGTFPSRNTVFRDTLLLCAVQRCQTRKLFLSNRT